MKLAALLSLGRLLDVPAESTLFLKMLTPSRVKILLFTTQ